MGLLGLCNRGCYILGIFIGKATIRGSIKGSIKGSDLRLTLADKHKEQPWGLLMVLHVALGPPGPDLR